MLGDALGVLYDVLRLKARDPVLNAMAADMALILAPLSLDVRAAHIWTQRNCVCDALSRLEGDDLSRPAILKDAARTMLERPKCTILRSHMPQTPNLAMSI